MAVPLPPAGPHIPNQPIRWLSQPTRNIITSVAIVALWALGRWSGPSFAWSASLVLGGTLFYNEVGQRIHKQISRIPFELVAATVGVMLLVDFHSVKYLITMLAAADLGYRLVACYLGELQPDRANERIRGIFSI